MSSKSLLDNHATTNGLKNPLKNAHFRLCLIALLIIKILVLWILTWNTRFVMDEFQQLGFAKYLGNGIFDKIWPAKALGYAIFYKVAHILGWDAVSVIRISRIQTAVLTCVTLFVLYKCAGRLYDDKIKCVGILVVLLSFSNYMERSFRTIAEPLALFFASVALLILIKGSDRQLRSIFYAGFFLGLSFLATQKAVYFSVAMGLALVLDSALARNYRQMIPKGFWLTLGWLTPLLGYCVFFGGLDPIPIARHLVFGPVEVATTGADAYKNLRNFVTQTITRNAVLYAFCLIGVAIELRRIRATDEPRRRALFFTLIITIFVFTHNQPWPYVFIMAQPFLALWSMAIFDYLEARRRYVWLAWAALGVAVVVSFIRNASYLQFHNVDQLNLIARAERLLGPDEIYFDGVAMVPTRREPTTLWLDRGTILKMLRQKGDSELSRVFAERPPKVVLWTYRAKEVERLIGPHIRSGYASISPNVRIAGRHLRLNQPVEFNVPVAGTYALYGVSGRPIKGKLEVNGVAVPAQVNLPRQATHLVMKEGPEAAFLLPKASYVGAIDPRADNEDLFLGVYN